MPNISDFREKWNFYKPRARKLSAHFAALPVGAEITHDVVAKLIAGDENGPVPPRDKEATTISGAGFGMWFAKPAQAPAGTGRLPDGREEQWQKLTGLTVEIWLDPLGSFKRSVKKKAGELLGWSGLVHDHAEPGRLHIRPRNADPEPKSNQDELRFRPVGYKFPERLPALQKVWPGCCADFVVPVQTPISEADHCRIWMLAEYENGKRYMLDPDRLRSGAGNSSRVRRPDEQDARDATRGFVYLPRNERKSVPLPVDTPLGDRFEVLALVLSLGADQQDLVPTFDALEQRWIAALDTHKGSPDNYRAALRDALETTAELIEDHKLDERFRLYRQRCEVVTREQALKERSGND